MVKSLDELLSENDHNITTLANTAAFLAVSVPRINWVGFYLFDGVRLYLGPFSGKPACTLIEIGKGVCGSSALSKKIIIVEDVSKYSGHIACDADSRSEIVIPIITKKGELFGVLDVDSPELSRFGSYEKGVFEAVVKVLEQKLMIK